MKPVKFAAVNDEIDGVPVNYQRGIMVTRWQMDWRELWQVIWTRKIWVLFRSASFPPTLITTDKEFRIDDHGAT